MYLSLPPLHRSRNPLVRIASLLVGMALVALLVFFGLLVAGVLLVGGVALVLWRRWSQARRPPPGAAPHAAPTQVLEGEFVVIHNDRPHGN